MKEVASKQYFTRKVLFMSFLILHYFFISANVFSKKWSRDYIWIGESQLRNRIFITFEFFDFEFGLYNEHGYLEWCNFSFTTDGQNYKSLARCEVNDQIFSECVWVKMTNKLPDAKIEFTGNYIPKEFTSWNDFTNQWVAVKQYMSKSHLTLVWYVPAGSSVKNFRVTGKWSVTSINSPYYINGEIYTVSKLPQEKPASNLRADLKQKYLICQGIDSTNINTIKVYGHADAIVVSGSGLGENINVYTSSGVKIKSIMSTNKFTKIQLPPNQIYIVKLGKSRYKVAV